MAWDPTNQSPDDARADHALLDRIRARDRSALGELYDRHSRLLFSLVLHILRDQREAEEVLHDVFVSVWNGIELYDGSAGSPGAWLVRVARNRSIRRLPSRPAAATVESVVGALQSSSTSDVAECPKQREIARALGAIEREQRDLLVEAYYRGLTLSELAARHKLPVETVKARLHSGMTALRQRLSQTPVQR